MSFHLLAIVTRAAVDMHVYVLGLAVSYQPCLLRMMKNVITIFFRNLYLSDCSS